MWAVVTVLEHSPAFGLDNNIERRLELTDRFDKGPLRLLSQVESR